MEFAVTREALGSLYDETPTATLLCEPGALRVVAANGAAETMLGYAAADLGVMAWLALVLEPEQLMQALRAAIEGARSTLDVDVKAPDGETRRTTCDTFPARIGNYVAGAFLQLRPATGTLRDPLTGLPSLAVLDDRIDQALVIARRYSGRFAVITADVDGFGSIVARYGASAGDWVLRVVAQRVREALRRSDSVVRGERDRFIVLQPLIDSVDDAVDVAHKIIFAMHAPIAIDGDALDVRLSLGVAAFPFDGESREELLASLDRALHEAKHHARGLFRLASPE